MLSRSLAKALACGSRPVGPWLKRSAWLPLQESERLSFSLRGVSQATSDSNDGDRHTGRVKLWSEDRGYGFLVPLDGGDDVFVHRSALNPGQTGLEVGQQVSYSLSWNERKRKHWASEVDAQVPWEDEGHKHTPSASSRAGVNGAQNSHPQTSSEMLDVSQSSHGDGEEEPAGPSLLRQLEMQALEQQQLQQTTHNISSEAVASSRSVQFELPSEPMQVEPFKVPADVPIEQRLQLMAEHMEQLRLQSLQNQQLLLQGIYAMLQQQSKQTANLERALLAIAEKVGTPVDPVSTKGNQAMLDVESSASSTDFAQLHSAEKKQLNSPLVTPEVDEKDAASAINESWKDRSPKSNSSITQQVDEKDAVSAFDESGKDRSPKSKEILTDQASQEQDERHISEAQIPTHKEQPEEKSLLEERGSRGKEQVHNKEEPEEKSLPEESSSIVPAFHVVGTFNDWSGQDHILPCSLTVRWTAPKSGNGDMRREEFQILGDGSWDHRIFPAGGNHEEVVPLVYGQPSPADDGAGKKDAGHGRNWVVKGRPGTSFQISYDPETKAVRCDRA